MIRRPPRSTRTDTLLPYTTLFRSGFGIDGDIDEEAGLLAARLAFLHQFDDAARRGAPRLPGTAHRGAADRLAVHIVAERDVVERIVGLDQDDRKARSEEHTSELQSLMRLSYAVFCMKTKITYTITT